jgi:hypothetical protein
MKRLLFLLFLACASFLPAETGPPITALEAADAERLQAMRTRDREKLEQVFSDDLRYAHSNGKVDTKATFIKWLTEEGFCYLKVTYKERHFTMAAPGIALMTGVGDYRIGTPTGEVVLPLSFLGVWRLEDGHWRFLAWQSGKLPDPVQ